MDDIESMDIDCPELEHVSTSESLNPKIKTVVKNPTPEMVNVMVKNAMKYLKKPNGATSDDVYKYIEENYQPKILKSCINKALRDGVCIETFEKISSEYFPEKEISTTKGFVDRFKIKGRE